MLISKALQRSNHLIITGIAVIFAGCFPDFLQGVHDDKLGFWVFMESKFQLLIQPIAQLFCGSRKAKPVCSVHTEHPIHPLLQAFFIIFQCQIEDISLTGVVSPQRLSCADMIGKLCHQKRLTDFGAPARI